MQFHDLESSRNKSYLIQANNGLNVQNKSKQVRSNLTKIVSISAGCALLANTVNIQGLTAFACEDDESSSHEADCQKDSTLAANTIEVTTRSSPAISEDLSVHWSNQQLVADGHIPPAESAEKPEVIHPAERVTPRNLTTPSAEHDLRTQWSGSPNTRGDTPQTKGGSELSPTSHQIYGETIDLQTERHPSVAPTQTLRVGDKGAAVSAAQERLHELGFTTKVDGVFGESTKQAVIQFQASNNLAQDGIVGPQTARALFGNVAPTGDTAVGTGKQLRGVDNTAKGSSRETDFEYDSENVPLAGSAVLGINKSVVEVLNPDGTPDPTRIIDQAGDVIKYSLEIKNAGDVTLTGVTLNDPTLGGFLAVDETLTVGSDKTYSGSYIVTQSDIDSNGNGNGAIDNNATAISDQTGSRSDSEAVVLKQRPALKLEKKAVGIDTKNDGVLNSAGDIVEYVITVENTGNQTLTNISVDDPLLGDSLLADLSPGQAQTFTADYALTQADIDSNGDGDGDLDNTVTVDTDQTAPVTDFEEVDIVQHPDLHIEKRVLDIDPSGDGVLNQAGETVSYEVIVRNTGNQTLTNVSIDDSLLGVWIVRGLTLDPGASQSYVYSYTITQADLDIM
ncbi:MAG: peptidoglycan-binding domain-containing protein [Cyanobacteria bacterium P01_H01_bin.58]